MVLQYALYGMVQVLGSILRNSQPKDLDANESNRRLDEFSSSLGLNTDLPVSQLFEDFLNNRAKNLSDLEDIEIDGKNLKDALHIPAQDTANPTEQEQARANVLTAIKDEIFKVTDETKSNAEAYKAEIENLNNAIKDPNIPVNLYGLEPHIQALKEQTLIALKNQNQQEINALEAKFDNDDFKTNLANALGIDNTPEKMNEVKEALLEKLKKSHEKNLETAMTALDECQKNLHKVLRQEQDRLNFLAALHEHDAEMRVEIDRLAAKNHNEGGVSIAVGDADKATMQAKFKGISIDGLNILKTITGRRIEKTGPNEYTMTMPMPLTSPRYYGKWNQKLKKDFQSMTMAVRAAGHDKITMSVQHPNPDIVKKMAQEAYEACRLTGFDKENISIEVNGKKAKLEEIFTHSGVEAVEKKAAGMAERKQHYMKLRQQSASASYKAYKGEIHKVRALKSATPSLDGPTPADESPAPA